MFPQNNCITCTPAHNLFWDSSDGIEEFITSVTDFINKCINDVLPTVTICTYPNHGITCNICSEQKARTAAFKEQDTNLDACKKSCYALQQNIKQAKRQYRTKIDCVITISIANVSRNFKQVNIHKAAGPDRLPVCVLRACTDQLARVFTDIFNLSLTQFVILTCLKQTTIIPVPKNAKVTCLNDYRPIAHMEPLNTLKGWSWLTSTTSSQTPWIPQQIHMTQSLLHSTLPFPTWTKGTPI